MKRTLQTFKNYTRYHLRFLLLLVIMISITNSVMSQSVTALIGNGTATTGGTATPNPYFNYYTSNHVQYVILASELTAAGITASKKIDSLGFNVTNLGGGLSSCTGGTINVGQLWNFSIKMKNTSAINTNAGIDVAGLTTVFSAPSYTITTLGWDMRAMSSAFVWDGVSNLLVDVCHDNTNGTAVTCYTSTAPTYVYTTTLFNSVWQIYQDGNGSLCPTVLGTANSTGAVATRANMKIFATNPPPPPATPTSLTFTGVTFNNMTLNWVDNASNEDGYIISRSDDNGVTYQQVAQLAANATSYSATGLIPGKQFFWRVRAYNAGGNYSGFLNGSRSTQSPVAVVSTVVGGDWSSIGTWVGGVVPTINDSVVIVDGATVIINSTTAVCHNLRVGTGASGILSFQATPAATLQVNNEVYVAAGAIFDAGSGSLTTHNLRIGGSVATNLGTGSLTVDGSFDMNTTAAGSTVTFFGALNGAVNGTGIIDFRTVTVNKGAVTHVTAPVLDLQSAFTVQGANTVGLIGTHTAGVVKISGAYIQSNPMYSTAGYTIPLNGGLWLNNSNFTVSAQNGSPTCNGLLRVTTGVYNVSTLNTSVLGFGAGSMFTVDGGTVNAAARINSGNTMTFNMSSGTINVAVVGNNTSSSASFGITAAASVFNMTGGTINLVNRNTGATILDYQAGPFAAGNSNITGGVLNVGTGATATNFDFRIRGNVPNVFIDNTTNPKSAVLAAQLNSFKNITLLPGTTLDLNGQIMLHQGDTLQNDGYLNGKGAARLVFGVTTTTNTQRYFGSGLDSLFSIETQKPLGSTIIGKPINAQRVIFFDSMGFVNSNNITLGYNNLPVTLQYGQAAGVRPVGNFDVAPTLNVGTAAYNILYLVETTARTTGVEIPTSRIIRNLTVNNPNGVVLAGGPLTLEYGGVLTLTNGRVTTTSTNILNVQDSIVGSVSGGSATAYVNGPMTRQLPASLIVQRTYSFPVGKNNTYGQMDLMNPGTNAGGPVTVKVERFNAPTGGTLGAGTASIDTMFWRVELTSGASNIDSTNIRLNGTGFTGISRILYSPTLTGAYTPTSLGPISSTQIRTSPSLLTSANIEGYFAFGTQIIPLTGTYLVGASQSAPNYHNLTEVVADLAYKQLQGNVVFELQTDYTSSTEIFPLVFNNPAKNNVNHTVTIRPAAAATDSIVGSFNGPLMRLDGIRGFTLDGRQGGTGAPKNLIVRNNNTGASAAAVTFVNDAVRDTLKYVVLWGASTTATSGVVNFGAGLVTGNDSNAVMNSDIGGDTITSPSTLIQAAGSTDVIGKFNDYIVVSGCNLYNFWNTTAEANAFKVSNGNNNWTITNNSVYQMSITGRASSSLYYSFNFNGGNLNALNNTTITNNYIGGSLPLCGGTPWKQTSSAASLISYFNLGNLAMSNVKNNTFANIDINSTSTSTTGNGTFNAIQFVGGMMNIDSNIIGSTTDTSSIKLTAGSGGIALPISVVSSNTAGVYSITGNKIGGIKIDGLGATSNSLQCITVTTAGSNMRFNVNGNTIGNSFPENIIGAPSSSTTAQNIRGIHNTSAATLMITNNTIHNLSNKQTAAANSIASGITSTGGVDSIMFNVIDSINNAAASTGTGTAASVIGISLTSTVGNGLVTRNTIYALKNTSATGASWVTGINYGGGTNDVITRNMVHSFTTASTSVTSQHNGINYTTGTALVANNMVRLGVDETGASIIVNPIIVGVNKTGGTMHMYYNSVYVGGTGVGTGVANTYGLFKTAAANDTIADNVIVNSRSNATTGGSHYAVRLNSSANSRTNYNLYHADGVGSFIGNFNGTDAPAIGDWRIASTQDANSISGNPGYINATGATPNLHVSGTTLIEGIGSNALSTRVASVTDDYDGDNRATNTPVDLGADGGLFTPQDLSAPAINFTLLQNDTIKSTIALNNYFGITDISGVANTGVNAPRIYFKKKTDNNVFVGNTSADNGWKYTSITNLTSPYSMTINFSIINGGSINIGDTIQYFVVAQDLATVPNIGAVPSTGFSATSVSTVSSAPTTPAFFAILPYPLMGNYTVGTSVAADFPTLTEAGNTLKNLGVRGPVTFTLIDAAYTSPAETFPINFVTFKGASSVNTVTIRPNVGVNAVFTGTGAAAAVFKFSDSKYYIVDGLNTGGSSLTLTSTNTGTSSVVWLTSTGVGNKNISIKNTKINGASNVSTTSAGIAATLDGSSSAGGADNDTILISGNIINKCYYGIYANGTAAVSAGGLDAWTIVDNQIGPALAGPDDIGYVGIFMNNALNANISRDSIRNVNTTIVGVTIGGAGVQLTNVNRAVIHKNVFTNITSTTSTSGVNSISAINLGAAVINSRISSNTIKSIASTTTGGYGVKAVIVNTSNGANDTLINNMISDVWDYADVNTIYWPVGIDIEGTSGGIKVYNNSVNVYGTHTGWPSATGITGAAALFISASGTGFDVRNNILVCSYDNPNVAIDKSFAFYSLAPNTAYSNINNNNYYVNGAPGILAYLGADQTTLAALKIATGNDVNSINDSTNFISQIDLHITGSTLGNLAYTGQSLPTLTVDIDEEARVFLFPYMGADENVPNPLPVTLASFTGVTKGKDAVLNWTTVSEINNLGFDVERSVDGRIFTKVDFVKGAGNSNRELNYNLVDRNVFEKARVNTLYYRLKQLDRDGKTSYSNVIMVNRNVENSNGLSAFPNPFNNEYIVTFNANTETSVIIETVDIRGKLVSTQLSDVVKGYNGITVNGLSGLQQGIYFVKVTIDGETQVMKLVKN